MTEDMHKDAPRVAPNETLRPLPAADLEHVLQHTESIWPALANKTLLITGGTGFFGKWLLESWVAANKKFGLNSCAWVLSRDPMRFLRAVPQLANQSCLRFIAGDVREFSLPDDVSLDYVIHAATPASASVDMHDPLEMWKIIVEGTQRVLTVAGKHAMPKVLMVSSGAVYGEQPAHISHVDESYMGGPDPLNPRSAYGEGKRQAEHICALYAKSYGLAFTVARCFAFVGPHLPLNSTYAVGNFIRDARNGGPVTINGCSETLRSYMYAADLACWLWHLLVRGRHGEAYNVGSQAAITIGGLAQEIADFYRCAIVVKPPAQKAKFSRYVPDVRRTESELGLRQRIDLTEALARTERYINSAG